ncbi:hypothetical protein ACG83_13520 [Frankia sp. R43]|nr:hypothetical protein ACG83_13520 [Frankia sp. R43]
MVIQGCQPDGRLRSGDAPEHRSPVGTARRQELAVGRAGYGLHSTAMRDGGDQYRHGGIGDIPEPCLAADATGHQVAAVRREHRLADSHESRAHVRHVPKQAMPVLEG